MSNCSKSISSCDFTPKYPKDFLQNNHKEFKELYNIQQILCNQDISLQIA